ncbi:MAG: acyltransferase [Deltaproteobacteria bacterium]|nr:acyltransferase [Deltaproteobacteria bacterium]
MNYRADIDGLRAVAVLSVLLYHAHVVGAGGGFVGVDVFFVISGFLITGIVSGEIERGRFSVARFYQRRVLRIFPALFAVVAATTIVGAVVLLPAAFRDFGQSIVATTAFSSNILFWRESGYFEGAAHTKPLLHTWSLSVEEQFYLLLPPALLAIKRFASGRYLPWLLVVAAASLALAVDGVQRQPTVAFYLVPHRAWELLLGSLLAVGARRAISSEGVRTTLAAAGLCMILGSVVGYDDATPFPGVAAIPPCLGAALIIATRRDTATVIHRSLQWRPLVVVGEISYSLYLWHWPIIVFVRGYRSQLGTADQVLIIVGSLALAYLSWRFVEQPFRSEKARARLRSTFVGAACVMTVAVVGGLVIHVTAGVPQRFGISATELTSMEELGERSRSTVRRYKCFDEVANFAERCLKPKANALLLGDSHADHLLPGLARAFPEVNFIAISAGGCRPLLGVVTRANAPDCERLNRQRFAEILGHHRFDAILLSAAWEVGDADALDATLDRLRELNDRVLVFGPIVEYRETVPMLLRTRGAPIDGFRSKDTGAIDATIREVAAAHGVAYASVFQQLCGDGSCVATIEDEPIQWDDEHLTTRGSEWLIDRLRAAGRLGVLESIGAPRASP